MAANATKQPTMASGRFVGHLSVTPTHGPVGTTVTLSGKGLPPHTRLTLIWETYDADWSIEQHDGVDWEKFYGIDFVERVETLGDVETDSEGYFEKSLSIPEDYGGLHDVYVADAETGQRLNKLGFRIDVSAELIPKAGPLGTPIQVAVYGLNPAHPFEGWYHLLYDNKYVGLVTAVTTRGTAHAEITATGKCGDHVIDINANPFGFQFLQHDVSPYSYVKNPRLIFHLTDEEPVIPPPIEEQMKMEQPTTPPRNEPVQPTIWTDYHELPAKCAITVFGSGFPANSEIHLDWIDSVVDHVTEAKQGHFGTGYEEATETLCTIDTDADGSFRVTVVPNSIMGGWHPIRAWHNGSLLSQTYVKLTRRPYSLQPKAGSVGTEVVAEIDGVGWTEHENEVMVCYDNAYIGYACGTDIMGKVVPSFAATGSPGLHYIDIYPAFRNPPEFAEGRDMPYYYRRPILSWRDHPNGFHVRHAFTVEEE